MEGQLVSVKEQQILVLSKAVISVSSVSAEFKIYGLIGFAAALAPLSL